MSAGPAQEVHQPRLHVSCWLQSPHSDNASAWAGGGPGFTYASRQVSQKKAQHSTASVMILIILHCKNQWNPHIRMKIENTCIILRINPILEGQTKTYSKKYERRTIVKKLQDIKENFFNENGREKVVIWEFWLKEDWIHFENQEQIEGP